ncbi:Adenylate cyclase 9 [Fasciola gigantica]|uniref:adenylate cyclase n=1 Tax=Fasciola gigantica TaxID=46835 RepID=A0A504YI32_FASGI|nr:Adenylate cyclase 9 [Fasciola gigantica]
MDTVSQIDLVPRRQSDDDASHLDRNVLHGHQLIELFEEDYSWTSVIGRFGDSLYNVSTVVRFYSARLTNYHDQVMLSRTKAQFRLVLKFVFCLTLLFVYEAAVRDPSSHLVTVTRMIGWYLPLILVYLFTMKDSVPHAFYVRCSFLLCLSLTITTFWFRGMITRQDHGLYSAGVVLLICMYAFLPLKLTVCICISVMFVITAAGLEAFHASKRFESSSLNTSLKWIHYDLFRRLRVSNRKYAQVGSLGVVQTQIMSWIPVGIIAIYLRFWNMIRRRMAFFKLGKSVQARQECDAALQGQVRWIEAIMPSVVREEYQALRKKNLHLSAGMWVFNKTFDNVSILFADIVGFTRMSSNKTAHRVVTMLNNLFNRFDELCEATKCEKIGTLGDCYYCVSGCPVPRANHAICCIEMGLGMCRVIKVFNCDFQESVGMRIGIHTGRVNAAIIGAQRFRFDVYSYDVIIASELESSGRPGRVHISEKTFELVKSVYNFSVGEPLAVRKEEVCGIAGMTLVTTYINTYFVDPRSSQLRKKHERFGSAHVELHSFIDHRSTVRDPSFRMSAYLPAVSKSLDRQESDELNEAEQQQFDLACGSWIRADQRKFNDPQLIMRQFDRDISLVHNLQNDPAHQYRLFRHLPVSPTWLVFYDAETEWHYRTQLLDSTRRTYLDSQKVAPISDVVVCFMITLIILVNCIELQKDHQVLPSNFYVLCVYSLIVYSIASACLIFISTTYEDQLSSVRLRQSYRILIRPWVRELCTAIITLTPTMILLLFSRLCTSTAFLVGKRRLVSAACLHCLLIHCVPLSSAAWSRNICALITFGLITHGTNCMGKMSPHGDKCLGLTFFIDGIAYGKFCLVFNVELWLCTALVLFVSRENERNCRLCFYVSREAEIAVDEAEQAMNEARDLLYNIIPKYVHDHLKTYCTDSGFSYAVSIPNAGVAFATISNFFSKYYREDYKGGENALKLLNSIVCMFDELLELPEMKDVEKVKTINDCYMVAAGLNREEVRRNRSSQAHLIALMNYCHLVVESLDEFNNMYIIGTDQFEVKVGYNSGPLIAGVIGTTKPMYDIWGNTVNVASRMYSTGLVGKIQVPQQVAESLQEYFRFVYRDEIFVKGKGMMQTYLCERK